MEGGAGGTGYGGSGFPFKMPSPKRLSLDERLERELGIKVRHKLIALLVNRNGCECHIFYDGRLFLSFAYKPSLRRQNFGFYFAQLRSAGVTNENVALVVQPLSFFKKPIRKSNCNVIYPGQSPA